MKLHPNKLLNPWVVFAFWAVLWFGRLRLIPAYYQRTFDLGYYPPEGDTIAIPIAANGIMTIVIAPVFAIVLWLLLRRSPAERRTWFAWNRQRWVLSLIWTALFVAFALMALAGLKEDIHIKLYLNSLADVGWFFFWLAVRAVVVSRIPSESEASKTTDSTLQPVRP